MRKLFCLCLMIVFSAVALPGADNRAALPSEKLPAAIGPVLDSLGALRSGRPEPQTASGQGFDVFQYPAEFAKAKMTIVISINAAGQVGGLFLRPAMPEPVN